MSTNRNEKRTNFLIHFDLIAQPKIINLTDLNLLKRVIAIATFKNYRFWSFVDQLFGLIFNLNDIHNVPGLI